MQSEDSLIQYQSRQIISLMSMHLGFGRMVLLIKQDIETSVGGGLATCAQIISIMGACLGI